MSRILRHPPNSPRTMRHAGPMDRRGARHHWPQPCRASWTLPTILAPGTSVLSPSSFHLDGQASLVFLDEVDVGLELPHHLVDVAAEVVEVHFAAEQGALGVDDERAAQRADAGASSYTPNIRPTLPVGSAPIGYLTLASSFSCSRHARCVNLRVGADRDHVAAHLDEPVVLLCQSSELGRSNEGEVGRDRRRGSSSASSRSATRARTCRSRLSRARRSRTRSPGTRCPSFNGRRSRTV